MSLPDITRSVKGILTTTEGGIDVSSKQEASLSLANNDRNLDDTNMTVSDASKPTFSNDNRNITHEDTELFEATMKRPPTVLHKDNNELKLAPPSAPPPSGHQEATMKRPPMVVHNKQNKYELKLAPPSIPPPPPAFSPATPRSTIPSSPDSVALGSHGSTPSSSRRPSSGRKMVAVSRLPSSRNLNRTSSIRGTIHGDISTLSRQQSESTLLTGSSGYHEGDELASFIHSNESKDDTMSDNEGDDEMSDVDSDKKHSFRHRTTVIGNPKMGDTHESESQAKKLSEEIGTPGNTISKAMATRIAAEERDLKLKARGGPRGELGRRRSAPLQYRRQVSRMSLANDQLPEDLDPRKKPIRASLSSSAADARNRNGVGLTQVTESKPSPRAIAGSTARPRRSHSHFGTSPIGSPPRDFKDRNDKVRAAMAAMGSTVTTADGYEVTARKRPPPPPPSSSRSPMTSSGTLGRRGRKTVAGPEGQTPSPSSASPMISSGSGNIGRRNRKSLASLEQQPPRPSPRTPMSSSIGRSNRKTVAGLEEQQQGDRSSKTRDSLNSFEEAETQWTVTARTPPKFRSSAVIGSTTEESATLNTKPAPNPTSLLSSMSLAETVTSGISMDTSTRNSIIEQSTASHAARRQSEARGQRLSNLEKFDSTINEKIAARTSPRFLPTHVDSTGAPGESRASHPRDDSGRAVSSGIRPSDEKAAYRPTASPGSVIPRHRLSDEKAAYRSAASPGSVVARHRPSDEKAAYRSTASPGSVTARHRPSGPDSIIDRDRPSDEKAAYRSNPSAAGTPVMTPGAYNVVNASPSPSHEKGLRLASGAYTNSFVGEEESVAIYEQEGINDEVNYDERNRNVDEHNADLSVQSGVPLVQPGAFAIDGVGNGETGYDSDVETSAVNDVRDEEEPIQSAIESTLSMGTEETAFQAELFHVVEGEVLIEEESPKAKQQVNFMQGLFVLLMILGATSIALGIAIPKRNAAKLAAGGDVTGVPIIEGWAQVGGTLIGPIEDNVNFGFSVAMSGDGNRLAIGLPGTNGGINQLDVGSVEIVQFNGTDWIDVDFIEGAIPGGETGKTVAMSKNGKRVAVASPGADGGRVSVYEENESEWVKVGNDFAGTNNKTVSFYGASLALSSDGKMVAISDTHADIATENDVGKVQVFRDLDSSWEQVGDDIIGDQGQALFGWALAISNDGKRVAATSLGTDDAGTARCFQLEEGPATWKQLGQTLSGDITREYFGRSVAFSEDGYIMAVGSPGYSNSVSEPGVGRVRVFNFQSDTWTQLGQSLEGLEKLDKFGESVALSSRGDILAIGAPDTDSFEVDGGHVQVHSFDGSRWKQLGTDLGASVSRGSSFGLDVALSAEGDRVALGAPFSNYDGTKSDVGQVRVFALDEEKK